MSSTWRSALTKWSVAVALVAVLVAGSLFISAAPVVQARFFDGCSFRSVASASSSGSGYTLTAILYAKFDIETGAYCGSLGGAAQIAEPPNGAGGTLTATLFFDSNSVTSSTTTGGGGASGATFSTFDPHEPGACGSVTAAFTSTSGVSLTASTTTVCPS